MGRATDIVLIRHAIALPRDSKRWRDDRERPLDPQALPRARKTARGLKRLADPPGRVLTSPLLRTRQTAQLLTQQAGWPAAVECPQLAPGEAPRAVLALLRAEQEASLIALVGHEPGLGELISFALLGQVKPGAFQMKRFAAARVSFPQAPRAGQGQLLWLVAPRLLRRCAKGG